MSDQPETSNENHTESESTDDATDLNEKLDSCDLDEATRALITKCCSPSAENTYEEVPEVSLAEMGFTEPPEGIQYEMGFDKTELAKEIKKLVTARQGTEVQVLIEDRAYDCHLTVLQIYAEYFHQFSCVDTIRLDPSKVSAVTFEKIYEWMIDDEATPQRENIVELYMAACYLKMPDLIKQMWSRFDNQDLFSEDRAFKLYLEALEYDIPLLQDLMITRIQLFFLLLVTTEEFLELQPQCVYQFLSSTGVCVNSEMEIFMCGIRWLLHDWQKRKEHAVLIMQAVRFNAMPAWYTTSLKAKQSDKEVQELIDIPEILNMINLGLSFAVTSTFMERESPLAEPLQMQYPMPRQWIIDEKASHHHEFQCPNWVYLDFEVFNDFLSEIICEGISYMFRLKCATPETMMPCCRMALNREEKAVKEGKEILISTTPSASSIPETPSSE